ADAKKLPVDFLRGLGLSTPWINQPCVRIPYFDPDGHEVAVRFRIALEGADRFRWRRGAKPCLYGLSRLAAARDQKFVVLVEGESDAHTLWVHDVPALGLPGATSWRDEWAVHLDAVPVVYVFQERDRGGAALLDRLRSSAVRERVRVVQLDGFKDPSALHIASPTDFPTIFRAALAAAEPWLARHEAARRRDADEALRLAGHLLHRPALLDRIGDAMQTAGYAGDLRAPLL